MLDSCPWLDCDHSVHESDRSLFKGNCRVIIEGGLFACGRKTLLRLALSSLRASNSDALGLLEGFGCIICFMMTYNVGLTPAGFVTLPLRRSCHS